MKIIKTLVLILVLGIGVFGQSLGGSCFYKDPVNLSGKVTPIDAPTTLLLARHDLRVTVFNIDTQDRQDLSINSFGFYNTTITPCYRYVVMPYVTRRGALEFPRSSLVFNGSNYVNVTEPFPVTMDFETYLVFY